MEPWVGYFTSLSGIVRVHTQKRTCRYELFHEDTVNAERDANTQRRLMGAGCRVRREGM